MLVSSLADSFQLGKYNLITSKPHVMAVINLTPDSFYAGSRHQSVDAVLSHAEHCIHEGASIIDIGAESTRPSAKPVSQSEELDRLIPVLDALVQNFDCPISVDTYKPAVMSAAIAAGAAMINDVYAFRQPGAIDAVKDHDVGLCLMHMQGEPCSMQQQPKYQPSVVAVIRDFFIARSEQLLSAGVQQNRLLLDPGFGFGKTTAHNISLLNQLSSFLDLGFPLLAGLSRKFLLKAILNKPVDERLHGSIALATMAYLNGATVIRAHDVAATMDALTVAHAITTEDVA